MTAARASWAALGLQDYRFRFERRCLCPPEATGPFDIVVTAGRISQVDGQDVTVDGALVLTVAGLHDRIEADIRAGALVRGGYDRHGLPVALYIDPTPPIEIDGTERSTTVDDELTYAAALSEEGPDSDSTDGTTHSLQRPIIRLLAAGSTQDDHIQSEIVHDAAILRDLWQEAGIAGAAPELPEGFVALMVVARFTRSTCRSPDDVVNVEIRGEAAVVRLDPSGEFQRPCPGPSGAAAWTAFAVAVPDVDGAHLRTVSVQLAESSS